MRVKAFAWGAVALMGTVAWPCAGPSESPTWSIAKVDFDPYGSGGFLSPANDSRANLLLLLADRQGFAVRSPDAQWKGPPLVFTSWRVMKKRLHAPLPEGAEYSFSKYDRSRCQTVPDGAEAFRAALAASRATPDEKAVLTAARDALDPDCGANKVVVPNVAATSPAGGAFATYLQAAAYFYGGQYEVAQRQFETLADAPDPWVRETSRYMVGRTLLNAAIAGSIGEWGDIKPPAERHNATTRAAGAAFEAYVKAYPDGKYRSSARGLVRRILWLEDKGDALTASYVPALRDVRNAPDAADLIGEIDQKALETYPKLQPTSPLLLAVRDLKRMRPVSEYEVEQGWTRLSAAELTAQAPLFRGQDALYGYLRAAHAFWVARDARAVLALIPDAAGQARFTGLEFSRQMLRGMALDAVKDRNARAFWLSLVPGATGPYQRGAVELALARHDELAGTPERVFAAGSPVTHPVMRDLLLEFTAGPDLLRRQATAGITPHERKVALFILLAKQLQRGFYADFARDYALLPPASKDDDTWFGAQYYNTTYNDELGDPPLGRFRQPTAAGGCPSIRATATNLAADPKAPRPRLCLAEFLRTQNFDNFDFDGIAMPEGEAKASGLGSGPSQFPGKPYVRMATYQAVLADPRATADDKAFALNRMVRCYAPAGYSSCGDAQADKAVRKGWFDRLKRDYPASPWAKDLRYYW